MKIASLLFKIWLVLFFIICLGVHIYGLYSHFNNESNTSHLVHLLSYTLCLLAAVVKLRNRPLVYLLTAFYPFAYHAHCAWVSLIDFQKLNGICIYVAIMMPLGLLWVVSDSNKKEFI